MAASKAGAKKIVDSERASVQIGIYDILLSATLLTIVFFCLVLNVLIIFGLISFVYK